MKNVSAFVYKKSVDVMNCEFKSYLKIKTFFTGRTPLFIPLKKNRSRENLFLFSIFHLNVRTTSIIFDKNISYLHSKPDCYKIL